MDFFQYFHLSLTQWVKIFQLRIYCKSTTYRFRLKLTEFYRIIERIDKAGAGFKSLTEAIDTTTPAGRMMMQMVGVFAEFEREMIRERTKAGLLAARAEGRIGGRKPKLREDQRKDIVDNVLSGRKSGAQMAKLYNISGATVSRIVSQYRHNQL